MNYPDLLSERFSRSESSVLLDCLDGSAFTYGEFYCYARQIADFWKDTGVKKGDVLVLAMPNSPSLLCSYLACAIGGYVACPVVYGVPAVAAEAMLSQVKHHMIVSAVPLFDRQQYGACVSGHYRFECAASDCLFVLFTSGLTGLPKAILHSFNSILGSASAFSKSTGMDEGSVLYHVLPMAYMAGILNSFFALLMSGGKIVEGPLFSPMTAISFWDRPLSCGVNTLSIVPTIASALLTLTRSNSPVAGIKGQLEQVQCTSAPIPGRLREGFYERFGLPLQNCYGMTELGGPLTFQSRDDAVQGNDYSGFIDGIDYSLRGDSEYSELWLRSAYCMLGYRLGDEVDLPVDGEGFMNTGDIAEVAGGRVKVTGRKKDIIIKGGVNVSPRQVEAAVSVVSGVDDVAVIGIEHEFWGEQVVACVVSVNCDIERSVIEHCKKVLPAQDVPDRVVVFDEFPRSFIGKLQTRKLVDRVRKCLG